MCVTVEVIEVSAEWRFKSAHVDIVMILCAGKAVRESLNAWQECAQFLGSYVNILCTSDRCWDKMHLQQSLMLPLRTK